MKIYQLVARGSLGPLDGEGKIFSKKVFHTMESALDYIEEFKRICTTPHSEYDLTYLESVKEVKVVTLELVSLLTK